MNNANFQSNIRLVIPEKSPDWFQVTVRASILAKTKRN